MKLSINNSHGIDHFELEYRPITLEIYYNQFDRDLTQDVTDCLRKYGSLSRSLAIRLIWACATTKNAGFMGFLEFVDSVEYKIQDYVSGWGAEFADWFLEKIRNDLGI